MYHYIVIDSISQEIILDSRRRNDFEGYSTYDRANNAGLASKQDNRLDCTYEVQVVNHLEYEPEENDPLPICELG